MRTVQPKRPLAAGKRKVTLPRRTHSAGHCVSPALSFSPFSLPDSPLPNPNLQTPTEHLPPNNPSKTIRSVACSRFHQTPSLDTKFALPIDLINPRFQLERLYLQSIPSYTQPTAGASSHAVSLSRQPPKPQPTQTNTQADNPRTSKEMAPMKSQNLNCSSNYGEDLVQQVNVLASCYIADGATSLKGLHYCTTGGPSGIPEVPSSGLPSPPTSPPLAALTSSNELALLPKSKKHEIPGRRWPGEGGAAHSIREECERFFCESMKTAFLGEKISSMYGSGLSGAYLQTPPPDDRLPVHFQQPLDDKRPGFEIDAWLEVWDYAGGASFRAFIADDGHEKSLFVFFDFEGVMGRDLKKALMALIELADGPLDCSHIVTCIDRQIPAEETKSLSKSLQWVGFEMITLDHWAHDLDVTSKKWTLMGMEI
ncbi:hypothetical protein G7046_g8189 [Stylonectria norvegica]|nr:hypothetical protein G7046_g8189 [Stylonectria norvegica]